MATKKKTNKDGTPRKRKLTKKEAEALKPKVIALKKERVNNHQISLQLGVDDKAVKRWWYEYLEEPTPEEIRKMRAQETELHEEIIFEARQDIRDLGDPPVPDWDKIKESPHAYVQLFRTWLDAATSWHDAKLKSRNQQMRASRNIALLNGLDAPKRHIVETVSRSELDQRLDNLLSDFEVLDQGKLVSK